MRLNFYVRHFAKPPQFFLLKRDDKNMGNYLAMLVYLLFTAQIGLTWRFHYLLLYHLSFGVLFVLALLIGLTFVIGFYLKDSPSMILQTVGKGYEL
jgi:hypothetical protein